MASLKEIMNIDEDSLGKEAHKRDDRSGSRSSRIHEPSSTSSFASPIDQPFAPSSAQSHRHSPLQHPHYLAAETPSSSSPGASTTTSRRRSNTSTDSMDASIYGQPQPYGQPYPPGYPGSSSGNSSRSPYGGSSVGETTPVKLTPITGRPSRAKKGMPVHTCETCRPPKTFTRAEHLRRHQLSHQPPELGCPVPGCDKSFHRKDLLERHQLRHEQDGPTRHQNHSMSRSDTSGSPVPSYQAPPASNQIYGHPNQDHSSGPVDLDSSWPVGGASMQHGDYAMDRAMGSMDYGPRLNIPETNVHWADPSNPSSSTSNSDGSFSASSTQQGLFSRAPRAAEWTGPGFPVVHSPPLDNYALYSSPPSQLNHPAAYVEPMGLPQPGYAPEGTICGSNHMPSMTVCSLTPMLAVAQTSETLVNASSSANTDRITNPLACGRHSGEASGLLAAHEQMQVTLSRAARSAIPAYLEVFWDKVNHVYPIIHKSTFEETSKVASEHVELLHCAMAAVATQSLEDKNHRINGNALHSYAWNAVKLYTQSEDWPLPVMQTVLLCEYYARFRGRRKESHQPSSLMATLYQLLTDHENTFAQVPSGSDMSQAWERWIQMESRRRLLSACFLLDVHTTCYFEQPPLSVHSLDYSDHSTLHIPLTTTTTLLWDATDLSSWCHHAATSHTVKTVSMLPLEGLPSDDIASLSPFDQGILLAAYALRLPRRQVLNNVDLMDGFFPVHEGFGRLVEAFPTSGTANTYLALYLTPLHTLLSVSGESWVFNRKVLQYSSFMEHKQSLSQWRKSNNAALAASFAARALVDLLNLRSSQGLEAAARADVGRGIQWNDISDYWGVYVCVLICWAFGHGDGGHGSEGGDASRGTALKWILSAADMEPEALREWSQRKNMRGVVCLARDILNRDCLGGRNILFADAVGVLKKLGSGETLKRS